MYFLTHRGRSLLIKMALFFLSGSCISGCVGFTSHLGTEEIPQQFAYYEASRDGFVKDKNSALEYWGQPISKTQLDASGAEEWIYRGGLAWRGVALWVVVPIPLMVPVGHNMAKMRFSPSGELVRGRAEAADEKGFVCFLIYLECNPEELP